MSKRMLFCTACVIAGLWGCSSGGDGTASSPADDGGKALSGKPNPVVIIETSLGTIKAELLADKAPASVANFLRYANDKSYDGTVFHRVIADFMIQGGGFGPDFAQKETRPPVKNEARADVKNLRGTLAMARTGQVDSATAQFFINVVDNTGAPNKYNLDHRDNSVDGFGYCVFGKVIEGMDVVDKIKAVKTGTAMAPNGMALQNCPVEMVVIKSVRVATATASSNPG